jgi:hypothetical protein
LPDEPSFEDIFPSEPEGLNTAVGSQEEVLRGFFGNERYEEIIKFNDIVAESNLDNNRAITARLNATANWYNTSAAAIPFVLLLAAGWSIARWVTWARR